MYAAQRRQRRADGHEEQAGEQRGQHRARGTAQPRRKKSLPRPGEGEVRVRNRYFLVFPGLRTVVGGGAEGAPFPGAKPGDPLFGMAVGVADALREWAAGVMAAYKVPGIELVENVPMTATGKIRKAELRPASRTQSAP